MKIVFIGCVEFSAKMLTRVMNLPDAEIVGVITKEQSPFNSDFLDLSPLAKQGGIDNLTISGNDQKIMEDWIARKNPDCIYCFGWSYLLSTRVLALPRLGVVGYHPARLPANRGRHPIIWALVLGLDETGSTFFMMDEGADTGDILSQEIISISKKDTAASLYKKMEETAAVQIVDLTQKLSTGTFIRQPQDPSTSNSWRKRSEEDGKICWRMPAEGIFNLVRALASPYPGAHCEHDGEVVKIWKVRIFKGAPQNAEPGKIIAIDDRQITIKAGDDAVVLIEHEFTKSLKVGDYL